MSTEVINTTRLLWHKSLGKVFESHSVKLDLANNGFHNLFLQTNEHALEFNFHMHADGFARIRGILPSSINVSSANLGILNHDFRGGHALPVSSLAVVASYTVSSVFYDEIVGISGAGAGGGGGDHEEDAWILASSTNYVFELQNLSGGAASFSWDLDWIEVRS